MCILQAQKMCTFEILSPRIDIVNLYCSQVTCQLYKWQFACVCCEDDVGYPCYLPPGIISIYFLSFDNWYSCLFFDLVQCFLDIVKVVIPPCAFCIQKQILYSAQLVGELSYFLQNTLLVILIKCVLVEGKPFSFGTLCQTLLRAWFVWNHPLFGSLTSLVQCVSMDISFLDVSLMISSK